MIRPTSAACAAALVRSDTFAAHPSSSQHTIPLWTVCALRDRGLGGGLGRPSPHIFPPVISSLPPCLPYVSVALCLTLSTPPTPFLAPFPHSWMRWTSWRAASCSATAPSPTPRWGDGGTGRGAGETGTLEVAPASRGFLGRSAPFRVPQMPSTLPPHEAAPLLLASESIATAVAGRQTHRTQPRPPRFLLHE